MYFQRFKTQKWLSGFIQNTDEYYVNCVKAENVEYIALELKCNTLRTIHLEPKC